QEGREGNSCLVPAAPVDHGQMRSTGIVLVGAQDDARLLRLGITRVPPKVALFLAEFETGTDPRIAAHLPVSQFGILPVRGAEHVVLQYRFAVAAPHAVAVLVKEEVAFQLEVGPLTGIDTVELEALAGLGVEQHIIDEPLIAMLIIVEDLNVLADRVVE